MSVTVCQQFTQNTWKRDLCSNCFKAKADHTSSKTDVNKCISEIKDESVDEEFGKRKYITDAASIYHAYSIHGKGLWRENFNEKLNNENNSRFNGKINKISGNLSPELKSPETSPLSNNCTSTTTSKIKCFYTSSTVNNDCGQISRHSSHYEQTTSTTVCGILKQNTSFPGSNVENGADSEKQLERPIRPERTISVGFIEEEPSVIGFGGCDYDSDDDDAFNSASDDADGELETLYSTEEDRAIMHLTEKNTEYNSLNRNLIVSSLEVKTGNNKNVTTPEKRGQSSGQNGISKSDNSTSSSQCTSKSANSLTPTSRPSSGSGTRAFASRLKKLDSKPTLTLELQKRKISESNLSNIPRNSSCTTETQNSSIKSSSVSTTSPICEGEETNSQNSRSKGFLRNRENSHSGSPQKLVPPRIPVKTFAKNETSNVRTTNYKYSSSDDDLDNEIVIKDVPNETTNTTEEVKSCSPFEATRRIEKLIAKERSGEENSLASRRIDKLIANGRNDTEENSLGDKINSPLVIDPPNKRTISPSISKECVAYTISDVVENVPERPRWLVEEEPEPDYPPELPTTPPPACPPRNPRDDTDARNISAPPEQYSPKSFLSSFASHFQERENNDEDMWSKANSEFNTPYYPTDVVKRRPPTEGSISSHTSPYFSPDGVRQSPIGMEACSTSEFELCCTDLFTKQENSIKPEVPQRSARTCKTINGHVNPDLLSNEKSKPVLRLELESKSQHYSPELIIAPSYEDYDDVCYREPSNSLIESFNENCQEEIFEEGQCGLKMDERSSITLDDKIALIEIDLSTRNINGNKRQAPIPPERNSFSKDFPSDDDQDRSKENNTPIQRISTEERKSKDIRKMHPHSGGSVASRTKSTSQRKIQYQSLPASNRDNNITPSPYPRNVSKSPDPDFQPRSGYKNSKTKKNKFSLKKLLKFGKESEDSYDFTRFKSSPTHSTSSDTSGSDSHPQRKPRPEILHPMDLASQQGEVALFDEELPEDCAVTFGSMRSCSSNERLSCPAESTVKSRTLDSTCSNTSTYSSSSFELLEAPPRPPPPPRTRRASETAVTSKKPPRPPPPKFKPKHLSKSLSVASDGKLPISVIPPPRPKLPPRLIRPTPLKKPTDYANLGTARAVITPTKPGRRSPEVEEKCSPGQEEKSKLPIAQDEKNQSPENSSVVERVMSDTNGVERNQQVEEDVVTPEVINISTELVNHRSEHPSLVAEISKSVPQEIFYQDEEENIYDDVNSENWESNVGQTSELGYTTPQDTAIYNRPMIEITTEEVAVEDDHKLDESVNVIETAAITDSELSQTVDETDPTDCGLGESVNEVEEFVSADYDQATLKLQTTTQEVAITNHRLEKSVNMPLWVAALTDNVVDISANEIQGDVATDHEVEDLFDTESVGALEGDDIPIFMQGAHDFTSKYTETEANPENSIEDEEAVEEDRPLDPSGTVRSSPGFSSDLETSSVSVESSFSHDSSSTVDSSESKPWRFSSNTASSQGKHPEKQSASWRGRELNPRQNSMKACMQPLGYRSLEENYGAIVASNREALAKILEQVNQQQLTPASSFPDDYLLQWQDFTLDDTSGMFVGPATFYSGMWAHGNDHAQMDVTLVILPEAYHSLSTSKSLYSLIPLARFEDLLPISLISGYEDDAGDAEELIKTSVWVLPRVQVETLPGLAENLSSNTSNNVEGFLQNVSFMLLQLIGCLKHLQALGIEEVRADLLDFAMLMNSKDTHYRLVTLADGAYSNSLVDEDSEGKVSLCQCSLTALFLLLQQGDISQGAIVPDQYTAESFPGVFRLVAQTLFQEKSVSLTRAKALLEYHLWGPNEVLADSNTPTESQELAYQCWLDFQRASMLSTMIRNQKGQSELPFYEELHLVFLIRITVKTLREVAALLNKSNTRKHRKLK